MSTPLPGQQAGVDGSEWSMWDSGPVRHPEGSQTRTATVVPDPATLSWLLRKASLDVWHARQAGMYGLVEAGMTIQEWLADIIREHGQEGTE